MNVYVRDLTRELARRGHEVDVFTRSQDPDLPRVSRDLGRGARVFNLPAGPERPYDKHRVYDHLDEFVAGMLAQADTDSRGYDVLHSHYWLSGVAARRFQASHHAPIVHMFHTLGEMKNVVAQRPEELETDQRIAVENEIVGFADRIIAATPAGRDQLVDLYGADAERIRIISPGVDTQRFHPIPAARAREMIGVCPDRRIILFVGRIEPLKGIDNLLHAITVIVDERPELRNHLCVPIIGGDPDQVHEDEEMMRLQELRETLGIGDVVLFLGAKDQDRLPYYYSAADVLVMPSDYESFGMVALEAMACGTPVIASDVGGLAFLVRDGRTGYRVPARDPQALGQRVLRLLNDESLRRRIGQQASCWAETYAWANIAEQIEGVYGEVLPIRGPASPSSDVTAGADVSRKGLSR